MGDMWVRCGEMWGGVGRFGEGRASSSVIVRGSGGGDCGCPAGGGDSVGGGVGRAWGFRA